MTARSISRRTLARSAFATLMVTALSLTIVVPARAEEPSPRPAPPASAQANVRAALQRDLHLSATELDQLLVRQARASQLNRHLSALLGPDWGGSWFDRTTGKLTVAVSRTPSSRLIRDAMVDVRVVKRSKASLEAIKAELDGLVRRDRKALPGVTAWSVDPQRNQVVVTVLKGHTGAAAAIVGRHGGAVRIEETAQAPQFATDYLDGGDPYNGGNCSVGFNVWKDGVGHFLTAGHCGVPGSAVEQGGVSIGSFVQSYFPEYDDALVRNDNPGYWMQGPWVFPYDGNPENYLEITDYLDSPVGTAVCKSGATTGLTCGVITAKNETVVYPQGTVHGLTKHNACVERGDSGGANYSTDSRGNFAEGMSSGSALAFGLCLEKIGEENQAWYQPIAASLAFYGASLMVR